MLKRERAEGPLVVVDAGLSLSPVRGQAQGAELEQRRIKADLIARAWATGGIDAIAVGGTDWSLGADFVRGLVAEHGLPLLAANLTCGGARPYPGGKVVEAGGRRIGLVGVTTGAVEGCEVGDPAPAIEQAVAELGEVDLVVGLLPLGNDREVAALPELPLDLAIDARGRFVAAGPDRRADTWYVGAGSRGKAVGLLALSFVPGAEGWLADGADARVAKQLEVAKARITALDERIAKAKDDPAALERLEAQRKAYEKNLADLEAAARPTGGSKRANRFALSDVTLDDAIADDPEIGKLVADAKARITTTSGGDPAKFVPRIVTDATSPYAGGEACVGCHPTQHAQWSTTGHARAWQTLVLGDRAFDADCWTCHVTGAGAQGGPPSAPDSGPWRDVQCEACHGPARAHVAAPTEVKPVRSPTVETCTTCHDGRKDEGRFDPATYLPRVRHDAPATP